MITNKKLIKSTLVVGLAVLTSRIIGFLRVIIFARFFGTNMYAQAFVVAFKLPNMLRDMIGEGATNAAIIPVLSEYKHKSSEKEYWEAANVILNLVSMVALVLAVIGVIFAPVIMRIVAPGFYADHEKFAVAVSLARWVFPYIFFLGIIAYCTGVLNSMHYFLTPAFASSVLNVTMIFSLLVLCPFMGIKGLVVGVLAGGVLQVAMQVPDMLRRGFKFEMRFQLFHPVALRVIKLMVPRLFGSAIYQMGILVDTVIASLTWIVGEGGVNALDYATRIVHLPLALFGISLATAALPKMSAEIAASDSERFKSTISFSLKSIFAITVPAAFGIMALSRPLVKILFERGEFDSYSTVITSSALFFYA
ncbi:MAG: murein biosynthesis integral membrane protein MurJ, partial [Candidatus Omnitrophica bacterium]|nr:murein biosynthesis integral membrane protein MurJ [Candidatus Omnitrophota bacterium]